MPGSKLLTLALLPALLFFDLRKLPPAGVGGAAADGPQPR